jgi:hypothetical protein
LLSLWSGWVAFILDLLALINAVFISKTHMVPIDPYSLPY